MDYRFGKIFGEFFDEFVDKIYVNFLQKLSRFFNIGEEDVQVTDKYTVFLLDFDFITSSVISLKFV